MDNVLENNIIRDNPFLKTKINKNKMEKIELNVHSDVIKYFKEKSGEIGIPFDILIDRYLSKALNPL